MLVIIMLFCPHINLYLDNFKNFRSYTVLKIYPYIAHIYATLMDKDDINEYLKYRVLYKKKLYQSSDITAETSKVTTDFSGVGKAGLLSILSRYLIDGTLI